MREDSRKAAVNMITMEEYLKKRQAIRQREADARTDHIREAEALKLAEILYV